MKFDDILTTVGEFGKYQHRLYYILDVFKFTISWAELIYIFIEAPVNHWCAVSIRTTSIYQLLMCNVDLFVCFESLRKYERKYERSLLSKCLHFFNHFWYFRVLRTEVLRNLSSSVIIQNIACLIYPKKKRNRFMASLLFCFQFDYCKVETRHRIRHRHELRDLPLWSRHNTNSAICKSIIYLFLNSNEPSL